MSRTFLLIAPVVLIAAPAWAGIIDVPANQSIQDAIDGAVNGDEVLVSPGTYHEAIDFHGKAVTIRSTGGPQVTVIDASGLNSSVVRCTSGEGPLSVLDGFTLTGGAGTLYGIDRLGGGMFCLQSAPTVRNCIFSGNSAAGGGGMANYVASPSVEDCLFVDNHATFGQMVHGGGAMRNVSGTQIITNCIFRENTAFSQGGAINNDNSDMVVTNCVFFANDSQASGGAIQNRQGHPVMINCTVNANYSGTYGGAFSNANFCDLSMENCIVWGNQCANAGYEEILDYPGAESTLTNSLVAGGWDGAGSGNLPAGAHPRFVNTNTGNLRLMPNSDAIDTGDSAMWSNDDFDLDGQPRVYNEQVDLGAYESQWWVDEGGDEPDDEPEPCPTDLNGDGATSIDDLVALLVAWGTTDPMCDLDGDGTVDLDDLVALLAGEWGPCPG